MVVAILNQKSAVGRLPSHRIWARALHIEGAEVLVVAPTRKARRVTVARRWRGKLVNVAGLDGRPSTRTCRSRGVWTG